MKASKYKFKHLVLVLFTISFLWACSSDDDSNNLPTNPLEALNLFDVSYGSHPSQIYDIYLPSNRSSSTKVFVLVHGGSWVAGDKNDLNFLVAELQNEYPDYAIVNINYRLASIGLSPFPMQINDIEAIINDLKLKQGEYFISNDFGFIGLSAGAHLSMLYSYASDDNDEVDMVASIVGPTNFTDTNYVDNPEYADYVLAVQLITGVPFATNPEYYENVSPYHVVTSNAPPSILFYGGQDELVPTSQGVDMAAKLDALNVINEFTLYPNEGHGWEGANLEDTFMKLENFINLHF
ncbi:alpha/beta hydrolase [Urechidicola sp. KH5]